MDQAVQLYDKILDPLKDLKSVGLSIAKSGFYGVERAESGEMIWLICQSERITPLQFFRTYDIVLGKPRKKAMACYAEFRGRGGKVEWIKTGDDGVEAEGKFTFEGNSLSVKFNIADAKKQELLKKGSAWEKTPGNMLRARVITNAIGMLCPEIVAGMIDGDDDSPAPEPKQVLENKPPVEKAKPVEKPTVVDAEIIEPKKPEAAKPAAPAAEKPVETAAAKPTEAPAKQKIVATTDFKDPKKLSIETVKALTDIIADHEVEALQWFTAPTRNWLPAGTNDIDGFRLLSVQRAQKILDNPAPLLTELKKNRDAAQGGAK